MDINELNDINADELNIDDAFIHDITNNAQIIRLIKKQFKRLGKKSISKLLELLLQGEVIIRCSQFGAVSIVYHNKKKFDIVNDNIPNSTLKLFFVKDLKNDVLKIIHEVGKEIKRVEEKKKEETRFNKIVIDGKDCYVIDKFVTYKKIRRLMCDEGGDVALFYDFEKPDLELTNIQEGNHMQRCNIQIVSTPLLFDYNLEYYYHCHKCGENKMRKVYEVVSSNKKHICEGKVKYQLADGKIKTKQCSTNLCPDPQMTVSAPCYYYVANLEGADGKNITADVASFKSYDPGYYECILYKVNNNSNIPSYHIVDIRKIESKTFEVPDINPEENYLFTLQKQFDKFIAQQTNMNIYGLLPIKVALIIQSIAGTIKHFPLNFNTQIVGDASTGKSTILKYYGFLLNNALNLSSNGLSISIPALRGTKQTVTLFGVESKVITRGFLGSFKTIHIDEAGENKELVKNLKTFLAESNYSYDKAGSTGVTYERTTHVNLSENLDFMHIGQYRGSIKKAYKENTTSLGGEEQPEWDDGWDLHLPLFRYTNPYLKKIIKEKREELMQKKVFWIDGYDYALHERFPFYFYLTNKKQNIELDSVVEKNTAKGTIHENVQLINTLKSDDITKLFLKMKDFIDIDNTITIEAFRTASKIFEEYDIKLDARMKSLYYQILQISRIANFRTTFEETDFDLLKWIIEKTNCKLDVKDTDNYIVEGPPVIEEETEVQLEEQPMIETGFNV